MEETLRLEIPVCTVEGMDLLPAGTDISQETIERVIAAGAGHVWQRVPLLEYGAIRRDLARYTNQGHYRTIFGTDNTYRDLEGLMAKVSLPLPCLQGLERFKKHDSYTYRHFLIVFALSCLLARMMGRSSAEVAAEVVAGPLHDFGKMCIPFSVLKKTTPLLQQERFLLEQHTLAGYVLLCYYYKGTGNFTSRVARDHHERRDGSGYPRGISLSDPLLEIVATCDIYDALISPRPYRKKPYDNRTALEELTGMAERGQIGWDMVRFLVAQNRKDKPSFESCTVSLEKRGSPPEGNLYGIIADGTKPRK